VIRWIRLTTAATAGIVAGAVLTLAFQGSSAPAARAPTNQEGLTAIRAESPTTFLAWVPGGLPAGFAADVHDLPELGHVAVVAEDDVWLARSWSAAGELVDHPPHPYRIPLDAGAVDPDAFAAFLPPTDRADVAALANGDGILGATSASLRGLGPGAVLDFGHGRRVRIAAVLPDEFVGAAELLVSRKTGQRIGIRQNRYLLLQPDRGLRPTATWLKHLIRPLLPPEPGGPRLVQVRAPGATPYFRAGDAVLPPVVLKALFGEFAARPAPRVPGALDIDPSWTKRNIVTTRLPVLGAVRCNRGIMAQLRGAMQELRSRGLQDLVSTYHGCYVPRFIGHDPSAMISYHTWGVAFDLNLTGNLHGDPPHQDPRLVRILWDWGFAWGGDWLLPDGNHFEYHRAPLAEPQE
jgi:hypothetical protein